MLARKLFTKPLPPPLFTAIGAAIQHNLQIPYAAVTKALPAMAIDLGQQALDYFADPELIKHMGDSDSTSSGF